MNNMCRIGTLSQIVLLTGRTAAPVLGGFLRLQSRYLKVIPVTTLDDLNSLPMFLFQNTRLISFGTDVIVPRNVLDALDCGAYNFHPGPPSHPGWAPFCFAPHDRAKVFGATAHRMIEKVDAGQIVGTELFPLLPNMTPEMLETEALKAMLRLFKRLGPVLATQREPLPAVPIRWGTRKRRRTDLEKMCGPLAGRGRQEAPGLCKRCLFA